MQSFSPADSANLLYSSSPRNEQLTSETNDLPNTPSHLDHWNADARSQIAFDANSSIKSWDIVGQDHRTPHALAATALPGLAADLVRLRVAAIVAVEFHNTDVVS